jgi:hypothetical protein
MYDAISSRRELECRVDTIVDTKTRKTLPS